MDSNPEHQPSAAPMRYLTAVVEMFKCVFGFFTPTLDCHSWVPFVRAMVVLVLLLGTGVFVLVWLTGGS